LAPRTVQNIPDCLSREAITVLHPASITPEPTNKRWRRNGGRPDGWRLDKARQTGDKVIE
jgi:hypothetical protein